MPAELRHEAQQAHAALPAPSDPAAPARAVRVWTMDESRVGLLTALQRRITLPGVAPVGVCQHERANFYVYGAAEVRSGAGYFAAARTLDAAAFQRFVDQLNALEPEAIHLLLVDNSRTHQAQTLTLPTNLRLIFLPPYSPDLNPIERL